MIRITYDGFSLTDPSNGLLLQPPEDFGTPPVRGSDLVIPFRHGAVPTQKFYDVRTITLNGYVYGAGRAILWPRIDRLKQALSIARPDFGPKRLAFIWPDGSTRYLLAEPRNTLGLSAEHTTFSPVSVEFGCADPFWHDAAAAQEHPYRLNDPRHLRLGNPALLIADFDSSYDIELTQASEDFQLPNPGVIPIEDAEIMYHFQVAAGNVTVTARTTNTRFTVAGPFVAGDILHVNCATWLAKLNNTDITDRLSTGLGQRAPLVLPTGLTDTINFSFAAAGSYQARVAIKYAAAYL